MRKQTVGVTLAVAGLLALYLVRAGGADEEWKPDPELLDRLGTEVAREGFQLRIPRNYKYSPPNTRMQGARFFTWKGAPRYEEGVYTAPQALPV